MLFIRSHLYREATKSGANNNANRISIHWVVTVCVLSYKNQYFSRDHVTGIPKFTGPLKDYRVREGRNGQTKLLTNGPHAHE